MKKLLLLFSITMLLLSSCSKDETEKLHSVLVNVTLKSELASPTLVRLYDYTEAKDFNREAVYEMGDLQKLVDKNGNTITPKYTSDSFTGVNIFENIESGDYMVIVLHKPGGYSFPNFYYYGYKHIVVNEANEAKLHTINFDYPNMGQFVQF